MAGKKVLIVDDESFFIEPIRAFLNQSGFETVVAFDGMSGLQKARNEAPDLIMLDLMLPGIDGYQVCRLLKFDDRFKHIPVIIVSAKDTERDKTLGKLSGAEMYMTKPVNPKLLIERIKALLS